MIDFTSVATWEIGGRQVVEAYLNNELVWKRGTASFYTWTNLTPVPPNFPSNPTGWEVYVPENTFKDCEKVRVTISHDNGANYPVGAGYIIAGYAQIGNTTKNIYGGAAEVVFSRVYDADSVPTIIFTPRGHNNSTTNPTYGYIPRGYLTVTYEPIG